MGKSVGEIVVVERGELIAWGEGGRWRGKRDIVFTRY